jgi:hypothetical protein
VVTKAAILAALLALCTPSSVLGNGPTLAELLAKAAPHRAGSVDALELGAAIAVFEPNPERAAMLLTIAEHESRLRATIARSECGPHECDRDTKTHAIRAWGLFQQHQNTLNADAWGAEDLDVQAFWAARQLRYAWTRCEHMGVYLPLGALRAYAGGQCDMPIPGEQDRLATFERIKRRIW